ncbi:MAG: hypothetical protein H7232_07495 [Aeromicrobium sp.]|nr:hypothetical protein [Burkholderiales bacterium]
MSGDEPNATRRALGGALLAWPLLSTRTLANTADDRVRVPAGEFIGIRTDGVCAFRGIRYGADTSRSRFQPPRFAQMAKLQPARSQNDAL